MTAPLETPVAHPVSMPRRSEMRDDSGFPDDGYR
jgi:hypothetical protein